jgi:pyrimidine deaminase RibD-like protein
MKASDFEIRNYEKLDKILSKLCALVVEGQKTRPEYFGVVAAAVLDPDNQLVARLNYPGKDGGRIHAERAAMEAYEEMYGDIPEGSIILTTCSPCSEHMIKRDGPSCTDYINDSIVKKVYCGYTDPTQEEEQRKFNILETKDSEIRELCKTFAETFIHGVNEGLMDLLTKSVAKPAIKKPTSSLADIRAASQQTQELLPPPHIRMYLHRIKDAKEKGVAPTFSASEYRELEQWVTKQKNYGQLLEKFSEGKEQFNYELAQKGFHFEQEINGITYRVHNKKGGTDNISIEALNDRGESIGFARFWMHQYKDGLESLSTQVRDDWQGKGIATNMYAVMRMLGVNIHPASMQSDDGKKMWDKWNKQGDVQHIKSMNAKMPENFADGKHPEDKGDAKRHGINTKASVSSLRKTAKQGGRKGQLAHWLANMKAGRAKK